MSFSLMERPEQGTYLLRAGRKSNDEIRDLEKARAYIDREIQRLRSADDLNGLAQREAQA